MGRVRPLRDFFLKIIDYRENYSPIVQHTGELLRRIWCPKQFKGQVSPYEFMQVVKSESKNQFSYDKKGEPLLFLTWLLNSMHRSLTYNYKTQQSIISQVFQGQLELKTECCKDNKMSSDVTYDKTQSAPFYLLGLDLPPVHLLLSSSHEVSLVQLLKKFDGNSVHVDIGKGRRRFRLIKLPNFLILSIRRFSKNNFFTEKNPTRVTFPIKNLDLKDLSTSINQESPNVYDLIASVTHEGNVSDGNYKVYIYRKIEDIWYEIQDLSVVEVLPQKVALSEAYLQVYERSLSKSFTT